MNTQPKQIADSKLITFAVGQQKKSRFQKAREEKELKQKLADEETAKVYDSFVSSFTEEEDGKTFVRGSKSGRDDDRDGIYGGSKGDIYRMERRGGSEMERLMNENKSRDSERSHRAEDRLPPAGGSNKGKREIDNFLNEIINRQESRTSNRDNDRRGDRDRDRHGGGPETLSTSLDGGYIEKGSYDNGDPTTTNLYLGNINPITTEERITELFSRYGEINSVKIMWPRTEEEKAKKRNCGFVSFMRRRDAEDALVELQDYVLDGFKMMLGWGKAVKINATPFALASQRTAADNAALDMLLPEAKQQLFGLPPTPTILPPAPLPGSVPVPGGVPVPPQHAPVVPIVPGHPPFFPGPPSHLAAAPPLAHVHMPVGGFPPPFCHPPQAPPGLAPHPTGAPVPPPTPAPAPLSTAAAAPPQTARDPRLALRAAPAAESAVQADEDLAHMSVDSFLDSIFSSTSTSTKNKSIQGSQASSAPLPVFIKPPPVGPPPGSNAEGLPPPPHSGAQSTAPAPVSQVPFAHIRVTVPADSTRKAVIDLMAKYCAADGEAFERAIKQREEGNPQFAFLFELDSPEGQYYRWRTYANVWGDSERRWHDAPLQWSAGGLVLAPPPCVVTDDEADTGDRETDRTSGTSGGRKPERSRKRSLSRSHSRSRDRRDSGNDRRRRGSPSPDRRGEGGRRRADSLSQSDRHDDHRDGPDSSHKRSRRSRSRSRSRGRGDSRDRGVARSGRERDRDRDRGDRDKAREREDRSRYAGMTGAQIEREKAKRRQEEAARLRRDDYEEWKRLLQELDLGRQSIKHAMGFAYDKVESAEEIISMVKDKLILPSSYAAVKIAGLYLLSDILHNTAAPVKHASSYRGYIQNALPEIVENLSVLFHNTTGRMSAFNIEDRVKKLFAVWAEWSVFPSQYLVGLQAVFYTTAADRSALKVYVDSEAQAEEIDGVSMDAGDQLEILRKRARLSAVPHTDTTTRHELKFRLDLAERFAQARYGHSGTAAISALLAPTVVETAPNSAYTMETDADIDGVPLDIASLRPLERMLHQQIEDSQRQQHGAGAAGSGGGGITYAAYDDDDDDIDGVPISLAEYSIPVSDQSCGPSNS